MNILFIHSHRIRLIPGIHHNWEKGTGIYVDDFLFHMDSVRTTTRNPRKKGINRSGIEGKEREREKPSYLTAWAGNDADVNDKHTRVYWFMYFFTLYLSQSYFSMLELEINDNFASAS